MLRSIDDTTKQLLAFLKAQDKNRKQRQRDDAAVFIFLGLVLLFLAIAATWNWPAVSTQLKGQTGTVATVAVAVVSLTSALLWRLYRAEVIQGVAIVLVSLVILFVVVWLGWSDLVRGSRPAWWDPAGNLARGWWLQLDLPSQRVVIIGPVALAAYLIWSWVPNEAARALYGVIGPIVFVGVSIVEALLRPHYSIWRNFVSQLSLGDLGWIQVANFGFCGCLILAFGLALGVQPARPLLRGIPSRWAQLTVLLTGLAFTGMGAFSIGPALGYPPGSSAPSWSVETIIHVFAGVVGFVSIAATCLLMARSFGRGGWVVYSRISGWLVVGFFLASIVTAYLDIRSVWPNAPNGILQGIAIVLGLTWLTLLALRLLRIDWNGLATEVVTRLREQTKPTKPLET